MGICAYIRVRVMCVCARIVYLCISISVLYMSIRPVPMPSAAQRPCHRRAPRRPGAARRAPAGRRGGGASLPAPFVRGPSLSLSLSLYLSLSLSLSLSLYMYIYMCVLHTSVYRGYLFTYIYIYMFINTKHVDVQTCKYSVYVRSKSSFKCAWQRLGVRARKISKLRRRPGRAFEERRRMCRDSYGHIGAVLLYVTWGLHSTGVGGQYEFHHLLHPQQPLLCNSQPSEGAWTAHEATKYYEKGYVLLFRSSGLGLLETGLAVSDQQCPLHLGVQRI